MGQLNDYIKEGTHYQELEGTTSDNAILEFQKVIDTYQGADYQQEEDSEYCYTYVNYVLMYIYSNKYDIDSAKPYADTCLSLLVLSRSSIFHYTDMRKFQEEALRYASNVVA